MGFLYKVYQNASYEALESARKKGIEVDKARLEEERKKKEVHVYGGYCKMDVITKGRRNFD